MKANEIIKILKENDIEHSVIENDSCEINGFSSIYNYKYKTITWVRHAETLNQIVIPGNRGIECIITDKSIGRIPDARCQIITEDPRAVFFKIVDTLWGEKEDTVVSPLAHIEDGAVIGKNVSIGDYTFVSKKAKIGDDCIIGNNVVIKGKVEIGDKCVVQSNTVIGEEGFAFIWDEDRAHIKHYGGVKIGNEVHIGSCCCVVRGTIDDTTIGDKVKIDNMCHIAHNVVVGDRSVIIPGTVLMGSVRVGHDTWISSALVRDQISVGNHCTVGMGAAVTKNVNDNTTVIGIPAKPIDKNLNII